MKSKKIISLTAMSLVMGSTIATANAGSLGQRFHHPVAVSEDIQAEMAALQSGDYESWKTAVEKSGQAQILEVINVDNFAKYAEAFRLRASGDMDGARAIIMDELGISQPERGGGMGKRLNLPQEDQQTLELAVQNADHDAWKTVMEKVENDKIQEYLTEDNFNIIVRAYKLRASGDRSGAMTLLDGANIPEFILMFGEKMHGGRGEVDGMDEGKQAALTNTYESGDYTGWKVLMEERGGGKILELVNADNFSRFSQAKLLQSEGKMTEAKEILDELGFPFQERGARPMGKPAFAGAAD